MKTGAARRLDPEEHPRWEDPEVLLSEIYTALGEGEAYPRELAALGMKLYPEHEEFQKIHHFLRPGKSRSLPEENIPSPSDSYDWIRRNSGGYRGKWVALCHGELIAASKDFNEVRKAIRDKALDPASCLLHFVA